MIRDNVNFAQYDLEKITELTAENNLAEVARYFKLTYHMLRNLRNKKPKLDAAIKQGILSRPEDFKIRQVKKCQQSRREVEKQERQRMKSFSCMSESAAWENYQKIAQQRRLEILQQEVKNVDLI